MKMVKKMQTTQKIFHIKNKDVYSVFHVFVDVVLQPCWHVLVIVSEVIVFL